jgi:hypothetical protein
MPANSVRAGLFENETGPATEQPADLSETLGAFRDRVLRDRLLTLEPQAACFALVFVGRHGSKPLGILQIDGLFQ